jgi:hypothetical protein
MREPNANTAFTEQTANTPFGDGWIEITTSGLIIRTPPAGYRRFRPILGTCESVQCATVECGRAADGIFSRGLPAWPYCRQCLETVVYFDSASVILARRDDTGTWRPTRNGGAFCEDPYDFDW